MATYQEKDTWERQVNDATVVEMNDREYMRRYQREFRKRPQYKLSSEIKKAEKTRDRIEELISFLRDDGEHSAAELLQLSVCDLSDFMVKLDSARCALPSNYAYILSEEKRISKDRGR